MQTSADMNEIAEALAKVQSALTNPERNRTVTVQTKMGRPYEFSYATLDAILEMIRKPLAEAGLSFAQSLYTNATDKLRLVTLLMHKSGQWIRTETPVTVAGEGMQALGSAQTYARRYAITALFGIAAEDDDANAADDNKAAVKERRTKAATTTTAVPKSSPEAEAWIATFTTKLFSLKTENAVLDLEVANEKALAKLKDTAPARYADVRGMIAQALEQVQTLQAG